MAIPDDEWDRFLELIRAEAREQEREVQSEIDARVGLSLLHATARWRDVRKAADYIAQKALRMREIAHGEPATAEGLGSQPLQHAVPLARRIFTGPVPEGGAWAPLFQTLDHEQAQLVFDRGRGLAAQILMSIPPGTKFSMADMLVAQVLMLALLARSVSAWREEETVSFVAELARSLLGEGLQPEDTQGASSR